MPPPPDIQGLRALSQELSTMEDALESHLEDAKGREDGASENVLQVVREHIGASRRLTLRLVHRLEYLDAG